MDERSQALVDFILARADDPGVDERLVTVMIKVVAQFKAADLALANAPASERFKSSATPLHSFWMASREAARHVVSAWPDHEDYNKGFGLM